MSCPNQTEQTLPLAALTVGILVTGVALVWQWRNRPRREQFF